MVSDFFDIYNFPQTLPFRYHTGNTAIVPCYPRHMHSHIEIIKVLEGSGFCTCDEREYAINPGDVVVFNSYVLHSIYSSQRMTFNCFIVDPMFCLSNGIDMSNLFYTEKISDAALNDIFDIAIDQHLNTCASPCYEARTKSAMLNLFIFLRENYTNISKNSQQVLNSSLFLTKCTIQYIMSSWQKNITLNELAEFTNVSPAHLSRCFKKVTGKTIVEFKSEVKCQMAYSYLKQNMSVSEVSRICGFESPSFFSKVFKKHFDISPSLLINL